MIISKDSNNNWTPVATGNGTFVGTKAAFDAVKDDLPDNTVAYTTDDEVEEEGIIAFATEAADGKITQTYNVTSASAGTYESSRILIPKTGLYRIVLNINSQARINVSTFTATIRLYPNTTTSNFSSLVYASAIQGGENNVNTVYLPLKAGCYVSLYVAYDSNSASVSNLGYVSADLAKAIMG